MAKKLLVPVSAIVLAFLAGLAIWYLAQDDKPRVQGNGTDLADDTEPGPRPPRTRPLDAKDFDAATVKPDPVETTRPDKPFAQPVLARRVIITGRVVSEVGLAISDARVTFIGEHKLRGFMGDGFTDNAGYYTLVAWAAQPVETMAADSMGKVVARTTAGEIAVSDNVDIGDATTAAIPDLVVSATSVIEGVVIGADGQPAPGAEVTATSAGPVQVATVRGRAPGVSTRQYVTTVTTDALGRYRITQLPPAEYGLTVIGYYHGAMPQMVTVDARQSNNVWQELKLEGDKRVRGVLTDEGGLPIAGAVVQLSPTRLDPSAASLRDLRGSRELKVEAEPMTKREVSNRANRRFPEGSPEFRGARHVTTDHAGRFGFNGVLPGEYILAAKLGASEARVEGIKPDDGDHTLRVNVNSLVSGVVTDLETGLPVEQFDARILPGTGADGVYPFERVAESGRFEYRPGGVYSFFNPAPGPLRVRISAPGYAPTVVSLAAFAEGDRKRDLDVRLQPLCEVSFRLVREGKPLDLEPVALLFEDMLAYAASSDELASVRVPDVTPAAYTVRVVLADGTRLEGRVVVPPARKAALELELK